MYKITWYTVEAKTKITVNVKKSDLVISKKYE